jgi:enoyl-CoA hydratase/carnithine racemase
MRGRKIILRRRQFRQSRGDRRRSRHGEAQPALLRGGAVVQFQEAYRGSDPGALVPDFRVASPEARFAANFVKIGFHPGFGLTYTLPRLIGVQKANLLFLTGRRITGEEAFAWGLADMLVEQQGLREAATKLAAEIAENAPLAVNSTRATVRRGLAEAVQAQTDIEFVEQDWLMRTEDHREGIKAVAERRPGRFVGK